MKREDGGRKKGETGTTTTTDLTKTGVRWIKRRREEEGERSPDWLDSGAAYSIIDNCK